MVLGEGENFFSREKKFSPSPNPNPFQEKRSILGLENTGFFEQSVILNTSSPVRGNFTSSHLHCKTQVLQLHIYCSRWSQLGECLFLRKTKYLFRNYYWLVYHPLSSVIVRLSPFPSVCVCRSAYYFNALARRHVSGSTGSPFLYFSRSVLDCVASSRRTLRRSPRIRAMCILSYAVV